MTKALSFVIIGAQKCGTTTLHEILKEHPEVGLPLSKERPIFDTDGVDLKSWDELTQKFYVDEGRTFLGKISPQYLATPGTHERIGTLFPDTKVVAILRDPVERTISHYRMCRRRGQTERTFEKSVDHWLNPDHLAKARTLPMTAENEAECCVVWSEYGRQLTPWIDRFGEQQVSVLYLADLEADPASVIRRVLGFIGADDSWDSEKTGEAFFVGGDTTRFSQFRALKAIAPVHFLWKLAIRNIPPSARMRFIQWNEQSGKRAAPETVIDPAIKARLSDHFQEDRARLVALGFTPRW